MRKIISVTGKVAGTFKKLLCIQETLKIYKKKKKRFLVETNNVFDPVLKAIWKLSTHPSIRYIKKR